MIGSYLNSLYSNCLSLNKDTGYRDAVVESLFNTEIDLFLQKYGFENEKKLIDRLISGNFAGLKPLLDDNIFIQIFYLVNSLSEFNAAAGDFDELGRYRFESSVQKQTGITNNQVLDLMHASLKQHPFLANNFSIINHKSYFFLSHDIDSLYGSTLQDGLWALKNKRFDVLLKLFTNVLLAKPHWFNIDLIMKLESAYDFKSTFYWLVNKGKIDERQTNSDYDIASQKLKETLNDVTKKGFENGLHKSISNEFFKAELHKLPVKVLGNRFHYLKFSLPEAYNRLEDSGLKFDTSLGFAEHYGFRNSYGYPFSPYNFGTGNPYSFLEAPLNIMDGTFQRYMKIPVHKTADTIIDFLEKHKNNCLLSVLWHNTFFTGYKYQGYRAEYLKIIQYFYDEKFVNINQSQIMETFSWKK